MPEQDPIEAALARLMPVALSGNGQRSIEESLDDLAKELPGSRWRSWRGWRMGLAACAAAAMAGFTFWPRPAGEKALHASHEILPLEWLGNSERVESLQDEGRLSGIEGDALQAVRLRVVEEKTLRDRETGYTFKVTEPRDELLLMPVSDF